MIYLHKLLPLLFFPLGIVTMLVVIGLLFKKTWLLVLALIVLYIFSAPFCANYLICLMEEGSERISEKKAPLADAIVVLSGCGLKECGRDKILEWGSPNRFFAGTRLFLEGKAPLLIFTGGWLPWARGVRPEGEILVEKAHALGIPTDALLTTGKVCSTEEEAAAVSALLKNRHIKSEGAENSSPSILLVTSAYHMPRAKLLFEKEGIKVKSYPVDFKGSPASAFSCMGLIPSAAALELNETVLREFYGRIYYQMKR